MNTESSKHKIMLAPLERLAVRHEEAAAMIGVSKTKFFELESSGKIGPIPQDFSAGRSDKRLPRFSLHELREWVAAGMPNRKTWQRRRGDQEEIR